MLRNGFYFFKEALRGFFQAKLMTFVSIVTIGLALLFLGCSMIAYLNITLWLKNASNRVEAVVFIKDSAATDSAAVSGIIERVLRCPQVARAQYVGKKEAWERFKEVYGTDMLNAVDDNPLPASIELSLKDQAQSLTAAADLQKELENVPGIEDMQISRQWVQLLERFKTYFLAATVIAALLLMVALHFMISNTIKLTIYARRELIRNMHFVGATNFYIKMPFILEGVLQGLIGGALSVCALLSIKYLLIPHVALYWGPGFLFLIILSAGALFGCIGSISAVRKFLL